MPYGSVLLDEAAIAADAARGRSPAFGQSRADLRRLLLGVRIAVVLAASDGRRGPLERSRQVLCHQLVTIQIPWPAAPAANASVFLQTALSKAPQRQPRALRSGVARRRGSDKYPAFR